MYLISPWVWGLSHDWNHLHLPTPFWTLRCRSGSKFEVDRNHPKIVAKVPKSTTKNVYNIYNLSNTPNISWNGGCSTCYLPCCPHLCNRKSKKSNGSPNWKGKSSSKPPFSGSILNFRGVSEDFLYLCLCGSATWFRAHSFFYPWCLSPPTILNPNTSSFKNFPQWVVKVGIFLFYSHISPQNNQTKQHISSQSFLGVGSCTNSLLRRSSHLVSVNIHGQ